MCAKSGLVSDMSTCECLTGTMESEFFLDEVPQLSRYNGEN